jgi:hypothetical protein
MNRSFIMLYENSVKQILQCLLLKQAFKRYKITKMSVSEMLKTITDMLEAIAKNPAYLMIAIGCLTTILVFLIPTRIGVQMLVGGLGLITIAAGILVQIIWLKS